MMKARIYAAQWCSWCQRAKALLRQNNIEFEEIDISDDEELQKEVIRESGQRTIPQIWIDGEHIGATTSGSSGRERKKGINRRPNSMIN